MMTVRSCVCLLLLQQAWQASALRLPSKHCAIVRRLYAEVSAEDPFFAPPPSVEAATERAMQGLGTTSVSGVSGVSAAPASASDGDFDYVVIGSGIGGLSCASLLSWYGAKVLVCESHYLPGGVAHTFEREGFKFDAGPSLWNGMNKKPFNPLREVLEIIGEGSSVKYAQYDGWMMHTPDGSFKFTVGEGNFEPILAKFGGPNALTEWAELNRVLSPIQRLAGAIPPLALRCDPLALLTLLPHLGKLVAGLPVVGLVEGSFKAVSGRVVKDAFLENWLEFLSFALSGLPADATIAAAVAYTMRDLHQKNAALDYPIGGAAAVIDALVRGVTKRGGQVLLSAHVESIVVEDGEVQGVRLRRGGRFVRAKKGVVSNASVWDTARLLSPPTETSSSPSSSQTSSTPPPSPLSAPTLLMQAEIAKAMATPATGSFVHLHLGIDATGLPPLESHYTVINQWQPIDAEQNHVIISIPSVLDPSLAPPGCHVIHAYAAANEPFAPYDPAATNMTRAAYEALKEERCAFLWRAIERSIPDVRSRTKVKLLASPRTHARFNRRYRGSFGPAWVAGRDKFPFPRDVFRSVKGLSMCGDSVFPGIGVPAVAASGANAASSCVSVWDHLRLMARLEEIKGE